MRDHDALVMKNEVEFPARRVAGVRGLRTDVGAQHVGAGKEGIKLGFTEESVEVACNDYRMRRCLYQFLQVVQLSLTVTVTERKMDKKDRQVLEFELDDEPLHAAREEMKPLAMHGSPGDESVALLVEYRNETVHRIVVVLALMHVGVMSKRRGNGFGLVATLPGTKRSEIDFHETEDVGIDRFKEADKPFQVGVCSSQVSGARYRQVEMPAGSCRVTNIVKDKAHAEFQLTKTYTGAVRLHMASE